MSKRTACQFCEPSRTGACNPSRHSPGGRDEGTRPFRVGKTKRDHRSGAWARRLRNRTERAK